MAVEWLKNKVRERTRAQINDSLKSQGVWGFSFKQQRLCLSGPIGISIFQERKVRLTEGLDRRQEESHFNSGSPAPQLLPDLPRDLQQLRAAEVEEGVHMHVLDHTC